MKCDFTYQHYREILKLALKNGYKFCFFSQYNPKDKKIIFLRHDIDAWPEMALKMAQIENRLAIKATYFFHLRCPLYNLFSPEISQLIERIRGLGHEIGLHFLDSRQLRGEMKLIKKLFNLKIKVVSPHNPNKNILNKRISGFINVFEPKFFSQIKYLSDSNMRWREGCLCYFLKADKYPKLQILIHPLFWSDKRNSDINERYEFALSKLYHSAKNYLIKDDWRWRKIIKSKRLKK